jgi:hypothetical protein
MRLAVDIHHIEVRRCGSGRQLSFCNLQESAKKKKENMTFKLHWFWLLLSDPLKIRQTDQIIPRNLIPQTIFVQSNYLRGVLSGQTRPTFRHISCFF